MYVAKLWILVHGARFDFEKCWILNAHTYVHRHQTSPIRTHARPIIKVRSHTHAAAIRAHVHTLVHLRALTRQLHGTETCAQLCASFVRPSFPKTWNKKRRRGSKARKKEKWAVREAQKETNSIVSSTKKEWKVKRKDKKKKKTRISQALWRTDALACINEVLGRAHRDDMARTLLRVFHAWNSELDLINDLTSLEVAKTGTLFPLK